MGEGVGRRIWIGLWFRKNLPERPRDPPFSRRSVVSIVGIAVLEELGEIATTPVPKEARHTRFRIPTDHVRELRKRPFLEFHACLESLINTLLSAGAAVIEIRFHRLSKR
jgi:hypothetical protein